MGSVLVRRNRSIGARTVVWFVVGTTFGALSLFVAPDNFWLSVLGVGGFLGFAIGWGHPALIVPAIVLGLVANGLLYVGAAKLIAAGMRAVRSGQAGRRRMVEVGVGAAALEFALDMWLNTEPDFPKWVWRLADPAYIVMTFPVRLCDRFMDVGPWWFELHMLTAIMWGMLVAWLASAVLKRKSASASVRP